MSIEKAYWKAYNMNIPQKEYITCKDFVNEIIRSEEMIFEVFDNTGRRVMWTTDEKAIPSKEELKEMTRRAGYKYKLNGKSYKFTKDAKGREE